MATPAPTAATTLRDMEHFRVELREFFAHAIPDDIRAATRAGCLPTRDQAMRWQRILDARGWGAPAWPREHGGTGWSLTYQAIFREELLAGDAPRCENLGIDTIGPTLIRYGTREQCQRHLPRILAFDDFWAQGYSEPEAGSDLAALRTTATRIDDGWQLDGTKIWQSYGHWANWVLVLARTDTTARRRQDGISVLLVDLNSPGVTVRPIQLMNGATFHVQIFFDQVRVPAENLVGAPHEGWRVAKGLLVIERLFLARVAECKAELRRVRDLAEHRGAHGRSLLNQPDLTLEHGRLALRARAHEAAWWPVVDAAGRDEPVDVQASMLKVQGSELLQDIQQLQLRVLGMDALPFDPAALAGVPGDCPHAPDHGENIPLHVWRYRGVTLGGGASEIQRQIIAKAVFSGPCDFEAMAGVSRSEDQALIADALRRLLADHAGFDRHRARIRQGLLHDQELWERLVELGLSGLIGPERVGGFGGDMTDLASVMEVLGSNLALEPILSSAMLATHLYLDAADAPAWAERARALIEGRRIACLAHHEHPHGHEARAQTTRADRTGARWCLAGGKRFVVGGHAADHFIVSAELPGEEPGLFELRIDQPGLRVRRYRMHDGRGCADIAFEAVVLPDEALLARGPSARRSLETVLAMGALAMSADSIGAMRRLLDLTVEHLRTRTQFGRPLGEQQVLRHRVVEHLRAWTSARALVWSGARDWTRADHAQRLQHARAAKAMTGATGKALALDAIQLHGAIGMQDESEVSHLAKRLLGNDALFGDAEWQLRQFAEELIPGHRGPFSSIPEPGTMDG